MLRLRTLNQSVRLCRVPRGMAVPFRHGPPFLLEAMPLA